MADINGTENDDLIEGTDQSDLIQARGGNDTVSAAVGDDWIRPGLGDDEIDGGFGNDILQYEGVYDGVVLNNTSSTRDGMPAYSAQSSDGLNRDTFVSVENFHLSHGDDVFYTDTYSYVFMRSGNDKAYIDDAQADIIPGSGADEIVSDAFASGLSYFDDGFDSLGNGDVTITSGIDVVYDGNSSSLLSGQVTDGWGYTDTFSGIEEIRGTQLADRFQGAGSLELTFLGGQGNDEILGGSGNDYLYGGMDDDTVVGNSGDDYLEGGSGQNTLVGGDGSDQFSLNLSGFSEISDYEAGELLWIEPNNDFDIQAITVEDLNLSYSSASNTTQISIDHSEGSTALADVTGQWFLDNVLFGDHLGLSLTNDSTREATTRHQFTSPDQITASSEIYAYSFDGYTFNEDENTEWTSGFEGKLVYYGSSDLEFTSVYNKNIEGAQTYITSGELFDIRLNGQSLLHDLWMNLDYQEITDVELGSPSNVSQVVRLVTSSWYWDYVENEPKLNEQTHLFNIGGTPLFSSPLNQEEVLNTVELIITPGNGYQTNTLANVDVIMSNLVAGERVTDIPGYRDNARTPYDQSLDGEVVQYDLTGFSFFEDETIEDSDFGDRLIGDPMSATLTVIGSPDLTGLSEAITLGSDASPFVDVLEDTRLLEGEIYEVFVNGIPLKDYTDGSMELSLERITNAQGQETLFIDFDVYGNGLKLKQPHVFYLTENKAFETDVPNTQELVDVVELAEENNLIQAVDDGQYILSEFEKVQTTTIEYQGNDLIYGYDDANELTGTSGNDEIYGFDGNDTINGLAGDDFLFGGGGDDSLFGGDGTDELVGGDGDDYINTGDNTDWDNIVGGTGNDTIDFADLELGYAHINYQSLYTPVSVDIDGAHNLGTIDKGDNGADTILDVSNPLSALDTGGLGIVGTHFEDSFLIHTDVDQWMQVRGGDGIDSYSISGDGYVRLDMSWAQHGVDVDLAAQTVNDDGYGNTETYSGTFWELRSTHQDDKIVGSSSDESFILRGGNDTLDGGAGFDRIRYDRNGLEGGIDANLATGSVTGLWNGGSFQHYLTNVEHVRGSDGDDTLVGDEYANRLEGKDGNDSLYGGAGVDDLTGGAGDDYINPGDNTDWDYIEGGTGNDTFDFSDLQTGYVHLGYDQLLSGIEVYIDGLNSVGDITKQSAGSDTINAVENALYADGLGVVGSTFDDQFDVFVEEHQWIQLRAGDGVDAYSLGGSGVIRLDLQDGREGVNVDLSNRTIHNDGFGNLETYTGDFSEVRGTNHDDVIIGSSTKDYEYFVLRAGNDTLDGGGLFDTVSYDRRSDIQNLEVDLSLGLATGTWDGITFKHELSNIEEVFGSANDDLISGSNTSDFLDGRAGNDTLIGGEGSDTFVFRGIFNNDVIEDFDETEDSLEFYEADGSVINSSELIESTDRDGNRVLSKADGLSSVTLKTTSNPTPNPAFDIALASTSGNVATFEIYATDAADAGNPGLDDVQFVLSHSLVDMTIDEASIDLADGFGLGIPNYDETTGELGLAAIAIPPVTDLTTPVLTFDATILNDDNLFNIAIDEILVDDTSQASVTEEFDFSLVEVESSISDAAAQALTDVSVSYDVVTPSDQEQSIALPLQGVTTVSQMMPRGSNVNITADKPVDENSTDAITANDALQALRLAVGLDKSDGTAEWHDYIAADINKDGQVSANDALNILKLAVGLEDAYPADWVFVDSSADWSDIDRKNTNYDEGVSLENVVTDTSVNMTGILVGDVNGSYVI